MMTENGRLLVMRGLGDALHRGSVGWIGACVIVLLGVMAGCEEEEIRVYTAPGEAGQREVLAEEQRGSSTRSEMGGAAMDYVYSEGSMGFHAPQESARILAEALDYARQGEALAQRQLERGVVPDRLDAQRVPVEGVTPEEEAPPGPQTMEEQRR